jgi:peroxiredoxin
MCISFAAAGIFFSCEQKNVFTITGKLQNFSDSTVFVTNVSGKITDTVACENSRFVIESAADSLTCLAIHIPCANAWLDVWVNGGDRLTVAGDAKYPELLEISGNAIHNKLSEFKKAGASLLREKADLHYLLLETLADSLEGSSPGEVDIAAKISNINHQLKEKADVFVRNNPAEPASVILLRDYLVDVENVDRLDEYLSLLRSPATESEICRQLDALSRKIRQTSVGAPAPAFEIVDVKSDTARLFDYKSEYLLLTFAASWCNICRKDNLELAKAYEKFRKKGLNMLTVSFDENRADWLAAAREDRIGWRQAVDTGGWGAQMLELYNISTIPSNFLIDRSGVIVCKNLYGDELMKKLNDVFM